MLFKIAFVILAAWLLGLVGVFDAGDLTHASLLVGLMLLLAVVKARDAAIGRTGDRSSHQS